MLSTAQCYTTCDWANPAKSTDFGSNGYTASLTDWHELLQLTAPDPFCGIVFIRGSFPDGPDAILARAQRRGDAGSKGTFGAQLMPESEFELGERRAQGLANFRWPYMQYDLKRKSVKPGTEEVQSGTYELISFIKDGTLFQITRIKLGRLSDISTSDRANENRSTMIHTSRPLGNEPHSGLASSPSQELKNGYIDIRLGGTVRFGCPCSNASPPDIDVEDIFNVGSSNDNLQLNCSSHRYLKRLEMQFFNNGQPVEMVVPLEASTSPIPGYGDDNFHAVDVRGTLKIGKDVDMSVLQRINLSSKEPTILICSYSIRNSSDSVAPINISSLIGIDNYLGIASHSLEMTDRLWAACLTTNYDANEAEEICAIAKCAEQIICVSSVPVSSGSENEPSRSEAEGSITPKSRERPEGTGRQASKASKSSDMDQNIGIALVHNIIAAQYVDLQSTL
jgi:hypothetical protein